MFTIIGGDGKEYGPATAAQVRGWLAAGRANLDTKAKAIGSEEWRPLGEFPEFGAAEQLPPPLEGAVISEPTAQSADRGRRLVARLIDWSLEIVCCLPGTMLLSPLLSDLVSQMMHGQQPDFEQMDTRRLAFAGLVFGLGWLITVVGQALLLSVRSQSVGKLLVRVKVVRLDGTKAGFVHAWLLREAVVTLIGGAISIVPIIGPFMLRPAFHLTDWLLVFRKDERCLHDLIAGTRVVNV
jgi:uncharacterized RDD family membrane protein YckC